jgi:hypothetical protein
MVNLCALTQGHFCGLLKKNHWIFFGEIKPGSSVIEGVLKSTRIPLFAASGLLHVLMSQTKLKC